MALIHVYSGAVGLADGTSWTDAYTHLQLALSSWTTADSIYVATDHDEASVKGVAALWSYATTGDTTTINIPIYSVDRTSGDYSPATTGQFVNTAYGMTFSDQISLHGLHISAAGALTLGGTAGRFQDCIFKYNSTGSPTMQLQGGAGEFKEFINCTFTESSTGSYFITITLGDTYFYDCVFSGTVSGGGFFRGIYASNREFYGCDFSGLVLGANALCPNTGSIQGHRWKFVNCLFPASLTKYTATTVGRGTFNEFIGCSDTGVKHAYERYQVNSGSLSYSTTIYKDDGYIDSSSATALSLVMANIANVNKLYPLFSPWMYGFASTTGSKTFTCEFVHDYAAALLDTEIWMELFYLGTTSESNTTMATDMKQVTGTLIDPIGTGSDQATSTVAWTGASGLTKQKCNITATVNEEGLYMARLCLAKYVAGKSVWFNPKLDVT